MVFISVLESLAIPGKGMLKGYIFTSGERYHTLRKEVSDVRSMLCHAIGWE
jgi:hypothetical protein